MMFANVPDEFIADMLHKQFVLINSVAQRPDKNKAKNAKCAPPADACAVNIMFFIHAFREAQERGLLNALEQAMGLEIEELITQW